jgi:hypothetical protein
MHGALAGASLEIDKNANVKWCYRKLSRTLNRHTLFPFGDPAFEPIDARSFRCSLLGQLS